MDIIRNEIKKLNDLGRMPNESLDDPDSIDDIIDEYDELLESIEKPITYEEAEIIIGLFPENAFYDLHWTLLHLIESLFKEIKLDDYKKLIEICPSEEWKETLTIRLNNSLKKNS
ncbi:hypothetical protein KLA_15795 [Cellulophaga geojensis KL-A]|uniref:Uncharacterized protein n=1 Tax=Cellulophaga geojensis KL-A TaxID=1328323 RepID=A0ABN0RK54_9FLAO|nr:MULTISPECIES: hypothetical protein [Cellulophaga]EWH11474.1 hypothetical protein KLA_15795 [Cellulophaga geojensis KL-A]MDO6855347.1 hypothetical protein [Cellulophaga lytica]